MKINWNSFYAKQFKKAAFKLIICIVICTVVLLLVSYKLRPIKLENCNKIDITVQRVEYSYWYGAGQCHVYSDDIKYVLLSNNNYSSHKLYEIIKEGDELTIIYTERFWIQGNFNLVVDARVGDLIYIDSNEFIFDKNTGGISFIVIVSTLELLVLSYFVYEVFRKYKDLKKNSKK